MKTLKQLERLRKIHKLIQCENTGTPQELAAKLYVSERQLYNILEQLREMDAPVVFNRKTSTYYYNYDFDLLVNVSVKVLVNEELKTIYAGKNSGPQRILTA